MHERGPVWKAKSRAFLFAAAILLPYAAAQEFQLDPTVEVRVRLEPPVIPYHRQATYTIIAEGPADAGIKLPDMVDKFGGLAVYGSPEFSAENLEDGRVHVRETYVLDAIHPGDYVIAPVTVTHGDGKTLVTASPALRVRELTPEELAEAEQFNDSIAYPSTEPPVANQWQWWAGAAAIVVLAAIAVYYWRRRKPVEAAMAPRQPWELAYDRLRTLDQRQYPHQGKYGAYYVDLSAILRYYIEDRFHVHAPEQTTPEFLSEISGSGILSPEHERLVAGFLRHCDRVKFAQYRPSIEEMERSFTQVLQFVDETVPRAEAPEEAAA